MKRISSQKYGCNRETLLQFYEKYIFSKINYGLTLYSQTNKANLKKVRTIENNALRLATGAFKTTPINSLLAESKIIPLETRIKITCCNWYQKNSNKDINHPIIKMGLKNIINTKQNKKKMHS